MKRQHSPEELSYIRKSILDGTRIDFREDNKKRNFEITTQRIERSDGCIQVKRGLTEIEVSLRFEENDLFLHSANLLTKEEFEERGKQGPCFRSDISTPFNIDKYLETFFADFKLSINLEAKIIKNDGCILSLFFDALRLIFSKIRVPRFKNMHEYTEEETTVHFSSCESFAFLDKKIIADPTLSEEMASDYVVHLLKGKIGNVMGVFVSGTQNASFDSILGHFPISSS